MSDLEEKDTKRNVPKLRFPGFTDPWEQRKLGDMVEFYQGQTYSPVDIADTDGILVLRSSNVQHGQVVSNDDVHIACTVKLADNVRRNDIIVVVRNGSRSLIGKHALIRRDMPNTVIGAFMVGVRSEEPFFANALFDTAAFDKEIEKNLGATINQITGYMFGRMSFLVPSISEQRVVGSFFNDLDNLIALRQRELDHVKLMKRGLLQKMFPKDGADTPEIRFPGFADPWEQRKVRELLNERNERAPKSDEYPLMAFIANEGVAPKGERFDRSALINDTEGKLYKRTKYNDFIYSSNNLETGSIGLNKYGNACISPVYSIFETSDIADPDFIGRRFTCKDFIYKMVKSRQGVIYGQWRIHESDFLKIDIEVPGKVEQKAIGYFFNYFDNLITLRQRELDHVKLLKKSLLQQMFV